MSKKPYEELEAIYVSSSSEWKEAQEEATKRDKLFVDIVYAMFGLSLEYRVYPGVSPQQAYLTQDPSMLQITLGDLIEQSVPPTIVDATKLAVTRALHENCSGALFGPSGPSRVGPRQMLKSPLRTLCGITTKTPHFEFVREGVSRGSASTEDILSNISPSPLTHAILGAMRP